MKAAKKPILDIFRVLSNINNKNADYFSTLTDEERKGFLPYVIQRWLYSTPNQLQYILLNECCNRYLNSNIVKHPELIYKLLTVGGTNNSTRYSYVAPKTKKNIKSAHIQTVAKFYNVSTKIAAQYITVLQPSDIMHMGVQLGYQPDELKKLK